MPKAQALAITRRLKRWVIGGTLAAFLGLAGLAAAHVTGVTATGSSDTGTDGTSAQPSNSNDGGGFFGPQPGFGTGGGAQSPFSGTGAS